jgi:hypothetical protein
LVPKEINLVTVRLQLRQSPAEIKGYWDIYYYQFLGQQPPFEPINGTMVLVQPDNGCHPITNAAEIRGNIAVATQCKFWLHLQ